MDSISGTVSKQPPLPSMFQKLNQQLLTVLDKWTEALNEGYPIGCVYMDYAKASDTVPHRRLTQHME